MFFDPLYFLIVGPFMLLAMWASFRVKRTFNKYAQVAVRSGMTGAQAAAAVARAGGLQIVTTQSSEGAEGTLGIERVGGFLSDHYDPRTRVLRLSPEVFEGRSIASIAVAAHEAGHAIQHSRKYALLNLRSRLVPVTQIGSRAWIWVFFGGLLTQIPGLIYAGIVLFSATVLFQLVTLPVEFDASNRAKTVLADSGIVTSEAERDGVADMLGAAAMTYVAGALSSIATLIYLLMRANSMGRRA